jgi:hypothetical protein
MTTDAARPYWDGRGLALLWLSVLSGPAAWAANQLVVYALVKPVCANDARVTLVVVSAVALAVTMAGASIAWSCLARLRGAAPDRDRSRFLAVAGVALNLLMALLIVTAAVPIFVLSPCE